MVHKPMWMSERRLGGRDTAAVDGEDVAADGDGVATYGEDVAANGVCVATDGDEVATDGVDVATDGQESDEANKESSSGKQSGRLLDDAIYQSNDSSTQHSAENMKVPHPSQKKSFKSVVRRHFVKGKLFFLLHDLLQSIDDERRAHADLITSFQTAREITGPIRRKSHASVSNPVARRKRRSDIPLLERIEQNRRESRVQLEDVTIYSKELATVGQMKISAKTVDETENENSNESVDKNENAAQSTTTVMLQDTENEDNQIYNDKAIDSVSEKGQDKDAFAKRQRSKSLPAGDNEKLFAAYQLNRDERTTEIDQLVLNSILPDIEGENENRNISKDETAEQPTNGNESESDDCEEDINNHLLAVSVEANTDTDEDESNIQVVGSTDELENDVLDDDTHYDEDAEFKKLNDPNFYVLTLEHNRTQTSLQSTLDPIAEASSESCQSRPLSARESSSVIEIEAKESTLPWRDTPHIAAETVDVIDTNVPRRQDRRPISTPEKKCETSDPDNCNDTVEISTEITRKNNRVAQVEEQKSRNVGLRETKCRASQNGYHQIPTYIEYIPANGIDRAVINKVDDGVRSNVHLSKSKQTRQSRRSTQPDAPLKYELSNTIESANSTDERSKRTGNKEGNKSKHTQERQKKLVSIDLVGMYEDNTDLQNVEHDEISPSKQTVRKEKMKLAQSPKRSRSKSPKKKRAPMSRKYDLTHLSPKTINTSSDCRSRPLFSFHRSKADLSSRSNSTSSMEDMKDSYTKMQTMKDEKRHSKPDFVLWEHLDIPEEKTTGKRDRIAWNENHGANCSDNNNKYSGSTENDARYSFDTDSRTVKWNIPITEAIKNIKGSKQVPSLTDLSDTAPREDRVGRLYLDLKHERRTSGYPEHRRLSASERRKEMEEFSHL